MLTPKQKKFIEEYLIDLNATQSCIRAGYSKKTANPQGARLLANVSISEEIKKRQEKSSEKLFLTKEDALARQNNISLAYSRLLELILKTEKLTKVEERQKIELMMVIKASDSTRAEDFLSRHLGWNKEDDSKPDTDTDFTVKIV